MANHLGSLPSEIIFHIARFLDPVDIVKIQSLNKRFLALGRDDTLWREECFESSSFLTNLRRRRALITAEPAQEHQFQDLARVLASGNGLGDSRLQQVLREGDLKARSSERLRILANWDPSYPNEKVSWYDEFVARNAPICTSWLEQPRNRDSTEHEYLEVQGMGVYTPKGQAEATMIVAPIEDGSVGIWTINGSQFRKGSLIARSKSGLISVDPDRPGNTPSKRSKKINTGVTECVAVDSAQNKAYFAAQSGLVEVDLENLTAISHERFPFSITTLSEARHPVPLTVGTNLAIYLHDSRLRIASSAEHDKLDSHGFSSWQSGSLDFTSLLNPESSSSYTHLHQPGPLSILHSGSNVDGNGDIYVAGRFSNILNYDRRFFPKLRGTIFSGARLCSMSFLDYPFASMEKDLARRGELSIEQVWDAKTRLGKTLIACGEYNSKGSLEMYGLSPSSKPSSAFSAGSLQNSVMKNRQTSSNSKLLSVCNHGTRIVASDGGGNLKWFERDGFTEARRWNIAHGSVEAPRGIFGTLGDSYMDSGSGDIVIKLANTHNGRDRRSVNEDNLVLWTGEKLGLLSFSSEPGFTAETFEKVEHKTPEEARREREERTFSETMGRALEANANEVRWLRGLGLGLS